MYVKLDKVVFIVLGLIIHVCHFFIISKAKLWDIARLFSV